MQWQTSAASRNRRFRGTLSPNLTDSRYERLSSVRRGGGTEIIGGDGTPETVDGIVNGPVRVEGVPKGELLCGGEVVSKQPVRHLSPCKASRFAGAGNESMDVAMLNNPSIRQSVGINRQSGPPEREAKKGRLVEFNQLLPVDDVVDDPVDKLLSFSPAPIALPPTVTVTVPSPAPVSLIPSNTEVKCLTTNDIVAEYGLFEHDI